jgi:precorrin-3B synthase
VPATSPAADRTAADRAAADRCPGLLRLAEAADGYLARVRLPGGLIGAGPMRVLARLASELGDGRVELTSRGNVQLRGLAADAAGPLTATTRASPSPSSAATPSWPSSVGSARRRSATSAVARAS